MNPGSPVFGKLFWVQVRLGSQRVWQVTLSTAADETPDLSSRVISQSLGPLFSGWLLRINGIIKHLVQCLVCHQHCSRKSNNNNDKTRMRMKANTA